MIHPFGHSVAKIFISKVFYILLRDTLFYGPFFWEYGPIAFLYWANIIDRERCDFWGFVEESFAWQKELIKEEIYLKSLPIKHA